MRTLFHGGDILTMTQPDDAPECLVIQDEDIVWVGDLAEGQRLRGDEDARIDLGAPACCPGSSTPTITWRCSGASRRWRI